MKKLILITMIISFSSLSIFAASKSEIEKLGKYECEIFEIENSIEIFTKEKKHQKTFL